MQLMQLALDFNTQLGAFIVEHGAWVYPVLFAIIFVEIAFLPCFFLPGDPLLFFCGALCATGAISVWIVMPVLLVATIAGSMVNFGIGTVIGEKVFEHERRWIDKAALEHTRAFFEARGGWTFVVSPFIAVVRTFAPFVAGVSQMAFARFSAFALAGAVLWTVTLVPAGYWFGNIPLVHEHLSAIVLTGIAAGVGALVVSSLLRSWRARPSARMD